MNISLNLSRNYIPDWGVQEGLRELIQNALDSNGEPNVCYNEGGLRIASKGVKLDKSTLTLGCTSKSTSDRGHYGEGYKLACLALLRAGCDIKITNFDETWTPNFTDNTLGVESLHMNVGELESYDEEGDLVFTIKGVADSDYTELCDRCLFMQDIAPESFYETSYGNILTNPQYSGKIFCGGLYVSTEKSLKYGYDIKPEYLPLDRDRKTVIAWDFEWKLRDIYCELSETEPKFVADAILGEYFDVSNLKYTNEILVGVSDYILKNLDSENGEGALYFSNEEQKRRLGNVDPSRLVCVDATIYKQLSGYDEYESRVRSIKGDGSISLAPSQYYIFNRDEMLEVYSSLYEDDIIVYLESLPSEERDDLIVFQECEVNKDC